MPHWGDEFSITCQRKHCSISKINRSRLDGWNCYSKTKRPLISKTSIVTGNRVGLENLIFIKSLNGFGYTERSKFLTNSVAELSIVNTFTRLRNPCWTEFKAVVDKPTTPDWPILCWIWVFLSVPWASKYASETVLDPPDVSTDFVNFLVE